MSVSESSKNIKLDTMRHSFAHLMAAAVDIHFKQESFRNLKKNPELSAYSQVKFGVGPVIENGCYYDFLLPRNFIPDDLKNIEKIIKDLLKKDLVFEKKQWGIDNAIAHFTALEQNLKVELLENLKENGTTKLTSEEKQGFDDKETLAVNPQIEKLKIDDVKTCIQITCDNWLNIMPNLEAGVTKDDVVEFFAPTEDVEARWINSLDNADLHSYVLKIDNVVIGCFSLAENEIKTFYIHKNYHGLGYGKILMSYIVSKSFINGDVILKTNSYNEAAIKFYVSCGFKLKGQTDDFILKNGKKVPQVLLCANIEDLKIVLDKNMASGSSVLPEISTYRIIDKKTDEVIFEDLCKGPHVSNFEELKTCGFKLDKFSAAYWRGDQERNINMQRLYAIILEDVEMLNTFLTAREEAKKFDHRILGQQLDLFSFSELVGAGLPLFSPRGTVLRNTLKAMLFQVSKKYGCLEVTIPHMAKIDLYETSGHAKKFSGELFHVKSHYDIDFVLKPVNCPHHTQIFASRPRSYKDLPLRYIESTMQYRDEKPGAIGGLTRVRSITCDDGHTFCTPDQIKEEILLLCKTIEEFYTNLGMYGNHWVSISVRDYSKLDGYTGFAEDWDKAETMLKEINFELGLNGKICEGEAAIYGPKLDFMYKDLQGNERQLSTIQLDFATPKRFNLEYKDKDGTVRPPVMIHRAILGSYERFLAILLESTKGKFPFWLAPEQLRILTINDQVIPYVQKLESILNNVVLNKPLKYNELRFSIDSRSESLNKKVKEARNDKTPMLVIIGDKDVENEEVSVEYNGESYKIALIDVKNWLENLGY